MHCNQAITIPSHCARITWSLATTRTEGCGPVPGLHSDTWVCCLQLLLGLTSAVFLASKSRRTCVHVLLSRIQDSPPPLPTWRARSLIYISQEQGGTDIPPDTGFPFCHLIRFAGLWWRYSILFHLSSVKVKVKVKVTLRLMVSQSVCLGVEPKYGTFDQRFFFFLKVTILSFIGAPSLTRGRVCHVSVLVFEVYSS
jgi:hypothetical protein